MAEDEAKQVIAEVVDENEVLPKQEATSTGLIVSSYDKFVGFREKLLKGRAEAESWEDQIVEKQAAYNNKLKEVHGHLAQREIDANKLKDAIVGK